MDQPIRPRPGSGVPYSPPREHEGEYAALLDEASAANFLTIEDEDEAIQEEAVRLLPEGFGGIGISLNHRVLTVAVPEVPEPSFQSKLSLKSGIRVAIAVATPPAWASLVRRAEGLYDPTPRGLGSLLRKAIQVKASDVHLAVGDYPWLRVRRSMERQTEWQVLSASDLVAFAEWIAGEKAASIKDNEPVDIDGSVEYAEHNWRFNLFREGGALSVVLRLIPSHILSIAELGLPPALARLADIPKGLVLFGGETGSGKTTTQASFIDYINERYDRNIIMLEDPTEYRHTSKRSLLRQRELGRDTESYQKGLESALRENPDVILIGEIRNAAVAKIVLEAANTGHLVFATVHANDTEGIINRLINFYPGDEQDQARDSLASALQATVTQVLLPAADDPNGMALVAEIMVATPAIRSIIRRGETDKLNNTLENGTNDSGMQTFDVALANLVIKGRITLPQGRELSKHKDDFDRLVDVRRRGISNPNPGRPTFQ